MCGCQRRRQPTSQTSAQASGNSTAAAAADAISEAEKVVRSAEAAINNANSR
jgi:hypothetical protein